MNENQRETPQTNTNEDISLNQIPSVQLYSSLAIESLDAETRAVVDDIYKKKYKSDQFTELVEALNNADLKLQYRGCIGLRKLLSKEGKIPIQNTIDWNCVPRFIEFIQSNLPVLQHEALWCLTNITGGGTTHQTKFVVNLGAIPLICKLLSSKYTDILEQAIWALGNISADLSGYRDLILKCGGMAPLVNILMNTNDKEIIQCGVWTMSNLCRGRPLPDYELIKDATEPLCKLFMQEVDQDNLSNISWAICYLSDGDVERIQRVVNTGIVPKLIQHIGHSKVSIKYPCLLTLGNICRGKHEQIDLVLSYDPLHEIFRLINHSSMFLRQTACSVLSSIIRDTSQLISLIIQTNGYVEELFKRLLGDSEEVSREVANLLSTCTSSAHHIDILKLVEMRVIEVYSSVLKQSKDEKTLEPVLESICHILECGEKHYKLDEVNPFAMHLKSFGFLEELSTKSNAVVQKSAKAIIEKYFETQDPSQIIVE